MFDDIEESLGSYGNPSKHYGDFPKHVVTITTVYTSGATSWHYEVRCNICGVLGTYNEISKAENRKSTHDREQDAGSD